MGAGAAGALLGPALALGARPKGPGGGRPLNVILMIADGMSPGVLQLADHYARLDAGDEYFRFDPMNTATHWGRLARNERATTTLMSTSSANGPVTDSAAAGTAFSVGARTNNGMLCVMPDGRRPMPLGQRVKASGRPVGIVTTTHLAHATPAAFLVNHPDRGDYAPIAAQMLAQHADVMLGGGADYFTDALIRTHAPHMHVVRSAHELAKGLPHDAPTLGLFTGDHMSYEIDREDREPSLADMTRAAIQRLSRSGQGFFLMVEGGRVDHAAHANDIASLLRDQIAYDEALGAALAFAEERGDTLVITTSDHANANPGITHYAERGAERFRTMLEATTSFERMFRNIAASPTVETLTEQIETTRKLTLADDERAMIGRALDGEAVDAFRSRDNVTCVLGAVLANHYSVAFCSPNHTSDHVVLSAFGPMADRLPKLGHIVDLHAFMARALALD